MKESNNVTKSIAHTKWNCKYHIVSASKYRRKVFFEEKRLEIREILRTLCVWKGVEIIEDEICPDHVHLLLSMRISISNIRNTTIELLYPTKMVDIFFFVGYNNYR